MRRTLLAILLLAAPMPTVACAALPARTAPTDPSDSLANPPTIADGTRLSPADLQTALDLARARLRTVDRYKQWHTEKWRYDTWVSVQKNGHVYVMFAPTDVTDSEVMIEVDVAAKVVVKVDFGMA